MEVNFPELENKILKYWRQNKTFEKSVKKRAPARDFIFYEGPPTANAKPGIHHVLSRAYKDIICRYKTMQGYRVIRKAGWDTHGLPVELEIEKKLGLKSKKDIEKYGIGLFNKKCRESVWEYKKDWEQLTERIGFWLDMQRPYITYDNNYIESLWWIIKKIYQQGLLYQGYKVVPYCPRCGTSLSSHEVALGYKNIKENSIYVRFKLASSNWKNTSILSWTTTPWTLPGNLALAINPKEDYAVVADPAEKGHWLILAKKRLWPEAQIKKIIKGSKLTGLKYQPLFEVKELKTPASYKVYAAGFVNMKEGTGVVHTAVMYGEDDYQLGKKVGLPTFHTVDQEGHFIKSLGNLAGLAVKSQETEKLIIEHLRKRDLLLREEQYSHDYPFCWRCSSALLYYAKESWFINMQKVKKDLIANNQKINWMPSHLKEGRFGEWLKDVKDWAFSRERYWGTPLPLWQCKKCRNFEVIGSKEDLKKQKFTSNKYFVMRHGDSQKNHQRISSSWPEKTPSPLTKAGINQAKRAAKGLRDKKISLIFSSDLVRTKETSEIAAKELGAKIKFDKRLREFDTGEFNGKPLTELHQYWGKDLIARFDKGAPGGENFTDVKKRMWQFIKDIDKQYDNKSILIVSHEAPISLLEGMSEGISDQEVMRRRKESKIKKGEVRELVFRDLPYDEQTQLDFHKPYIDAVKFYCKKCKGLSQRILEVVDVWYDAGSMPFAQNHWPFDSRSLAQGKPLGKPKLFPADYISEAVDQTRGWFYTLLAVSALLGLGPAYKNVVSLEHVLDEKGEKMSKSKGNVVDPWTIIEKYGADAVRWYFYTVNRPGDPKLFREKDIQESLKKFIMTFWNSFLFYRTYAASRRLTALNRQPNNVLDKWIVALLHELRQKVTDNLEGYNITGAARLIESFLINDLSLWYIRRSRRRFQKPQTQKELEEASQTLGFVLLALSKLSAPFVPFLAEEIYRGLGEGLSCHLENWPKADKKHADKKLIESMEQIRIIVSGALAERAKAGIKVRQPLAKLKVKRGKLEIDEDLLDLIKEEVNVKEVVFAEKMKQEVELDTNITPKLREEGIVREVVRYIQEMRKKAGYKPKDRVLVRYSATAELSKILNRNQRLILQEARIKDFRQGDRPKQVFDVERETKVENQQLWLAIKKI